MADVEVREPIRLWTEDVDQLFVQERGAQSHLNVIRNADVVAGRSWNGSRTRDDDSGRVLVNAGDRATPACAAAIGQSHNCAVYRGGLFQGAGSDCPKMYQAAMPTTPRAKIAASAAGNRTTPRLGN